MPNLNINYLVREYNRGVSEFTLHKELKISREKVRKILLANKVQIRSHSERQKAIYKFKPKDWGKQITKNAHDAVRGKKCGEDELIERAKYRELHKLGQSRYELAIIEELRNRGLGVIEQFAVGKYNVDFLVEDTVAVEVYGGWHSTQNHTIRDNYILDKGFYRFTIWLNSNKAFEPATCADKIITFLEDIRTNKAIDREHRVIWSDGQFRTFLGRDIHNIPIRFRDELGRYTSGKS